jgi:hypothetical protein
MKFAQVSKFGFYNKAAGGIVRANGSFIKI